MLIVPSVKVAANRSCPILMSIIHPSAEAASGLSPLIAVLKAAPNTSGWRLLQYLLHSEDGLAGDKPIDLIRGSKEDIERAVRFATRLED